MTEELEYIPGRFVVNRIVRPRMACKCCDRIVQAALPSRPIERGRPGVGLLAHGLVNKYADHCPLYRQSQIFAREGIDLDRSTLLTRPRKTMSFYINFIIPRATIFASYKYIQVLIFVIYQLYPNQLF